MNDSMKQRLDELLADRASVGLQRLEEVELSGMLDVHPEQNDSSFEHAAAVADLAMTPQEEQMPDELKQRILADAEVFFKARNRALDAEVIPFPERRESGKAPGTAPPVNLWGWLTAAAMLIIALGGWWPRLQDAGTPPEIGVGQQMAELMNEADTLTMPWATTDDPYASSASGQVIWNNRLQKGFMRFNNLQVTEANKEAYQLWVFDKERDQRYPVDGGLFNVGMSGEVIIPIDVNIRVLDPALFAITVEESKGVMVSSRERIVLTADPAAIKEI